MNLATLQELQEKQKFKFMEPHRRDLRLNKRDLMGSRYSCGDPGECEVEKCLV